MPTGAEVAAIRDSLYFADAPVGVPLTVLTLYAGVGLVAVLVINAVFGARDTSRARTEVRQS